MDPGIKIWPLPQRIRCSRDILMDTQSSTHAHKDTQKHTHAASEVQKRKREIFRLKHTNEKPEKAHYKCL